MVLAAAGLAADTWWQYLLLFVAVTASWAGLPVIGATALGAAGVAASQGQLNLAVVVLVATLAGEVGGLIGYAIGNRWGQVILERPGKHQEGRRRMVERGERAYATWGRLAVFFTPAIVSGTAKMHRGQFVVWNLVASLAFAISVAASSYGVGRLATGNHSLRDFTTLIVGLAMGTVVMVWFVHRRRAAAAARRAVP